VHGNRVSRLGAAVTTQGEEARSSRQQMRWRWKSSFWKETQRKGTHKFLPSPGESDSTVTPILMEVEEKERLVDGRAVRRGLRRARRRAVIDWWWYKRTTGRAALAEMEWTLAGLVAPPWQQAPVPDGAGRFKTAPQRGTSVGLTFVQRRGQAGVRTRGGL
jgi:hypothetical protein